MRQPVASIQSTRSGMSSATARSFARSHSVSVVVSSGVNARGDFLPTLIRAEESRTGLVATAPSSMAIPNIPDRQAFADLAAPGPCRSAIARKRPADHAGGHLAQPQVAERRHDLVADHGPVGALGAG